MRGKVIPQSAGRTGAGEVGGVPGSLGMKQEGLLLATAAKSKYLSEGAIYIKVQKAWQLTHHKLCLDIRKYQARAI